MAQRAHSPLVGGSTANRLLFCPGSYQAILSLPPIVEQPSPYAEEGSFAHEVMAILMQERQHAESKRFSWDMLQLAESFIGKKFYDRALTQDHLNELIFPALQSLAELEHEYGGDFSVAAIEHRVAFPHLFESFGTVDLILTSPRYNMIPDWKFGKGHTVQTRTEFGLNPQLAYYMTAASHSLPQLFNRPRTRMVAAIIQPRAEQPLTHTRVLRKELDHFTSELKEAVREALAPNPSRQRGEHCEWAPCKVTCPLWVQPVAAIASLTRVEPDAPTQSVTAYGDYLALAKQMTEDAASFGKAIDAQLHAYLSSGGIVPGWRLKAKAKQRKWIDEPLVEQELRALGYEAHEIWERKLVPFSSADVTAKRLNVTIPEHLRVAPETNETTVCREDDPAPKVEPAKLADLLRASLKRLQHPADENSVT